MDMEPEPTLEPPRRGLFTLADLRRAAIRGVFVGLGAALLTMLMLGLVVFSPGITLGFVALIVVATGATFGLGAIPPSLVEMVAARRRPSTRRCIAGAGLALFAAGAGFVVAGVQLGFGTGFLMGRAPSETINMLSRAGGSLDYLIVLALYVAQFAVPCALVAGGRLHGGPSGKANTYAVLWNLVAAAVLSAPVLFLTALTHGFGDRDGWLACCGLPLLAVPGCGIAVCYAIADAIDARIARRGEAV